jgi:hypothetical protein
MYLPLALLIFITDAKSATHYVVGVENIEYLPTLMVVEQMVQIIMASVKSCSHYLHSSTILNLCFTRYQLIVSIKNSLITIMLILNILITLNGNQVIKLPLVI